MLTSYSVLYLQFSRNTVEPCAASGRFVYQVSTCENEKGRRLVSISGGAEECLRLFNFLC